LNKNDFPPVAAKFYFVAFSFRIVSKFLGALSSNID